MDLLEDYIVVMKAAGDRTRVRIPKMLQGGEICVCQVMAVLGMSSSTVSKHLSILKMAGLVRIDVMGDGSITALRHVGVMPMHLQYYSTSMAGWKMTRKYLLTVKN